MDTPQAYLNTDIFMPHGFSFLWQTHILFLHVLSNAGIAIACFLLPVLLFHCLKKNKDLPYQKSFVVLCVFSLFCGAMNLMAIWILWHPDYILEGIIKALAAISALILLFMSWRIIPQILKVISPNAHLLTTLVESCTDAVISETPDGIITFWNDGAEKLFGYDADSVRGENISLIIPPDKKEEEENIIARLKEGKKIDHYETERIAKDGRRIDVSVAITPVRNEDGTIIGASSVTRNISLQKRMEEKLRLTAAESQLYRIRLESILDNVADGLITIDETGTITSYNKACEKIFGYKNAEALGKNIEMLMPKEYASSQNDSLQSYIGEGRSEGSNGNRELEGRRKDGSLFPMELSVAEVTLGGQHLFSSIIRDISERKKAEADIARHTKELERSNQELEDFSHIVSHDLKEPIRGMGILAGVLQEDYQNRIDAKGVEKLKRITSLSKKIQSMIDELLSYSRLGHTELALQDTDIKEAIADIRQMMEDFIRERHADIIVSDDIPHITCDKPRVTELFRNLITNAIKYNDKEKPVVEIGFLKSLDTTYGHENNVFFVRDNGIGIDPEFHDDIFRIFKRLEPANDATGTGVGLTFVRKIIERHNGHIWLESEPGKGSTFYFNLESAA